ncbi:chaperone NapD [Dongia sp.]|uniref:chaperone NapD n=1 Tax=Dongia sp. TaxID=1977262 RepID=UPI0035ADA392
MPDGHLTRHISSLIVQVRPESLAVIEAGIAVLDGAEIHAAHEAGKLVVVLDTADEAEILSAIARIHDMPGVITASLIYHEIDTSDAEEI